MEYGGIDSTIARLDIATDSLRRSFLDITQWTIERYLSQVMDDVKDNLATQLQESNMSLIRELKDGMIQATTIDIPQLKEQLEAVASAQTAGEAKLTADIKEFFDNGKNSIVTDIGKIYRQCAEQIDKVQRQSDTTSEVMQELSASFKSLEEASVNATALQDVKDAIKSIQGDMAKMATSTSVEELRKMAEDKLKERGEQHTGLERTMEKLQKMFDVVQEKTEEYNRRSQELDIVYARTKRHIEQLKKAQDLQEQSIETSNLTSQDATRMQHEISTLRNVNSNLNATIQAAETDVKIIQAEQSRTAEKLSKLAASITSGDVAKGVQNQIGQLSNKIADLAKQVQLSQRRSEVPPSDTFAAFHTQISTHNRNSSPLNLLDDRQLITKTIDSSKAITYLEAKMVVNEQAIYNKIHSLERAISNLHKRKNITNDHAQLETKRTRYDTANASDSDLQDTLDEHALQLKDLISFLDPLRGTILSDEFLKNLELNLNQLISVSR
jgi:chromosome segregation ATPase